MFTWVENANRKGKGELATKEFSEFCKNEIKHGQANVQGR